MSELIRVQDEEDKKKLVEQYKVLVESIDKTNFLRETTNNLWTGINSALIGAISYFRNVQGLEGSQKQEFLWITIILGLILCYSWLSSILTIKKSVDIKTICCLNLKNTYRQRYSLFLY